MTLALCGSALPLDARSLCRLLRARSRRERRQAWAWSALLTRLGVDASPLAEELPPAPDPAELRRALAETLRGTAGRTEGTEENPGAGSGAGESEEESDGPVYPFRRPDAGPDGV